MERLARGRMVQPSANGGLVFTAGLNSPVATAARSQQQTNQLLYAKLQAEQRKNSIAELRADTATHNAHKVVTQAAATQQKLQVELQQVKDRLCTVNRELEQTRVPPKDVLDRCHALEATAHVHRQRLAKLAPGTAEHEACAEEAAFHTSVARRARHCAMTGAAEGVRHVHLNPDTARAQCALGERLDSILVRQHGLAPLAPPEPTGAHRGSAPAGYSVRVDAFMDAVCEDLRQGLARATEDYEAAEVAGPKAVAV